ncbi:MAG: lamin tail domain-containing protein, partial [Planctomycetota bacterium]
MFSSIKAILPSLVIIISLVGSVRAGCPVGDLNDDCQVDWKDILLFTYDWLDQPGSGSKANLDGFNSVNMTDFALLAENWWVVGQRIGALQVTIDPQQAINDGAKWRVDESLWRDSGYTETSLTVGIHKVEFKDIDGWDEPDYKMVEIYDGQTTTASGEYRKPLVISEFMAVNDSIFQDPCVPDESPDWIEIYNPTDTTINLDGWYLANWNSDNPDPNLREWQFPDVNIGPGEFRIVFASNNNIRDPNAPYLHTNFSLAQKDECVAIVAPDGNTIIHEYTPYPQQLSDISYGLAQSAEILVHTGINVRYHVPTSSDEVLGTEWTDPNFDDSQWDTGQTGLVFGSGNGTDVQQQMLNINTSLWTRISFYVEDPDFYDCLTLRTRYEDGYIAYLNGTEIVQKNFTGTATWDSMADVNRPDRQSSEFETVNLNQFFDLLRPSPVKNVLAIQALNDNVSNEAFLILPELIVAKNEFIPQYFTTPTPGTFNISGAEGLTSEVWFSHNRGFYDAPFQLMLSTAMDDAEIHYTLDGSRPTIMHGYTYTGLLDVNETTTIRAVAVKPGWLDSKVETHSYIFPTDVRYQSLNGQTPGPNWPEPGYFNGQRIDYGMDPKVVVDDARYSGQTIIDVIEAVATVSLATDMDNLFDPSQGIYVNAYNEGRAWERSCSVELIYPQNPQGPGFPDLVQVRDANGILHWDLPSDMRDGFQVDAGVRIRGGFSSSGDNPKHSFRLFFRSVYGDAKLRYPLFGDEGDDVFDHIDLRCSQNYSWAFQGDNKNTMVREVFSRDVQGEMGHPYTRSRYYHLYINGHYWGLFQSQERSEASWSQSYMGGDKEDVDVVTSNWTVGRKMAPTDGNRDAFDRLYDETIAGFNNYQRYYKTQGLNIDGTPNDAYERLLDVENLIDFMIIEYYTGDSDGPGSRFGCIPNNTWGIFNRINPDGWKWTHHDNEHTLGAGGAGGAIENLIEPFTSAGANRDYFNPHWLHEQLMFSNVDYRMKFADHVHRHFHNEGLMTLEKSRNRILNRAYQIDMAIIAESARWGDAKHPFWAHKKDDHWWPEINRLLYDTFDPWGRKTYVTPRVDTVLQQFKDIDWYPNVEPPAFATISEYIFIGNPNGSGTIYYTLDGNDPRLPVSQSTPGPLVTLVTENAPKAYLVPTVANGGNLLGNTSGEFDVTYYKANITVWNLTTAESVISNPFYQSQVIVEIPPVINYDNTSCPGHFANDNPIPGGSCDLDDYVIEATTIVQIPITGNWTFGVHSGGGFSLELTGPGSFYMDYPSPRTPGDSFAVFNVTTPGAYDVRLVFFERSGWSGVELFAAKGSHTVFNPYFRLVGDIANGGLPAGEPIVWFTNYFDHSSWSSGTGGIGYETDPNSNPNYEGLFNIDLEGQMYDDGTNPSANTSCYIRIPFTCGDDEYSSMILNVQYDDGFIAYLNGGEVARRVFPEGAIPQWNSSTYPYQHDDTLAINFEPIDISNHINLLREGNNILAFHGMNNSSTSSDFLISAELLARKVSQGDVNPHALTYGSYFMLDKSSNVKARILDNGIWSPLTGKIYPIGPVKENLRITEIMYNPKYTGDINDPNKEFIELKNIGPSNLNLNLVSFTEGIHYTFPDISLPSGNHVVVVKDRAAFESEYDTTGMNIAPGQYTGSLANNGEIIRLQDAIGQTILDFKYEDGWRPITDGDGYSLTIIDPTNSDVNRWGEKDSWRPSEFYGGWPGGDDPGIVPNPGAIVINEVMSHSNNGPDWIELHNTTNQAIDIGGWFLSDNGKDDANLMKYRIADGTSIAKNNYIVFYEDSDFNNPGDPGCLVPFGLSENGEEVTLSSYLDLSVMLTGYR